MYLLCKRLNMAATFSLSLVEIPLMSLFLGGFSYLLFCGMGERYSLIPHFWPILLKLLANPKLCWSQKNIPISWGCSIITLVCVIVLQLNVLFPVIRPWVSLPALHSHLDMNRSIGSRVPLSLAFILCRRQLHRYCGISLWSKHRNQRPLDLPVSPGPWDPCSLPAAELVTMPAFP